MRPRVYTIPFSHPALAARLMLRRKRVPHRVMRIPSGLHPLILRFAGFPGVTVPALEIDGRRVQGSLAISRALEELAPEPELFPADPERRRRVEEAERFGEAELQPVPRRLFRWGLVHSAAMRRFVAAGMGLPAPGLMATALLPVAAVFARMSHADDETVRADLQRLPELLERVDRLLEEGVIGGDEPNAADFQILTTVRTLLNFEDLVPVMAQARCGEAARRLVPGPRRPAPPLLPAEWIPVRRGRE